MTPVPSVQLLIPGAADDTAAAIGQWLQHLSAERGLSAKTLEAYGRDVRVFLAFLAGHLGGSVSLGALDGLLPRDVRAFMARRRGDGLDGRSIARALAAVRSFSRFLEREGRGRMAAFAAVRTPKTGRRLPRPLAVTAARRIDLKNLPKPQATIPSVSSDAFSVGITMRAASRQWWA